MFSELSLLREDTVWRTPNLVKGSCHEALMDGFSQNITCRGVSSYLVSFQGLKMMLNSKMIFARRFCYGASRDSINTSAGFIGNSEGCSSSSAQAVRETRYNAVGRGLPSAVRQGPSLNITPPLPLFGDRESLSVSKPVCGFRRCGAAPQVPAGQRAPLGGETARHAGSGPRRR